MRLHYGPAVDSASNINEYHECLVGDQVLEARRAGDFTPSCAGCLEILGACPCLYFHIFTFTFTLQFRSPLCLPYIATKIGTFARVCTLYHIINIV